MPMPKHSLSSNKFVISTVAKIVIILMANRKYD